jgi:hypothetical protein
MIGLRRLSVERKCAMLEFTIPLAAAKSAAKLHEFVAGGHLQKFMDVL